MQGGWKMKMMDRCFKVLLWYH